MTARAVASRFLDPGALRRMTSEPSGAVLVEGESLWAFVEASVRAGVERRRVRSEFVSLGLRSRDEARRTGDDVDADDVIVGPRLVL